METGSCQGGMEAPIRGIQLIGIIIFKLRKQKKKKNTTVQSYKCGEFQPGRRSLLRSEMLIQYSAVIRPSAHEIVFIFQCSRGSWYSPHR